MKEIVYRQAALDELTDLIEFIADDKPAAARRVLQAVEECIDHIAAFPLGGALVEGLTVTELNGMRRAIVTPYRASSCSILCTKPASRLSRCGARSRARFGRVDCAS